MGLLDKMRAAGAERREAVASAARERVEADRVSARERAEAADAAQRERTIDPAVRIGQPAWRTVLAANGIGPEAIEAVLDGNGGTIFSPGASSVGMPRMLHIDIGAVVIAPDLLAYIFRGDHGLEIKARRRSELDELRRQESGSSVQIVFELDRSFPDRGGQLGRADNWDIRAPNRDPDAVRAVFLASGFDV